MFCSIIYTYVNIVAVFLIKFVKKTTIAHIRVTIMLNYKIGVRKDVRGWRQRYEDQKNSRVA